MRAVEIDKDKMKLPDIEIGDEVKVGRFKNRKAIVKGFEKDAHGQPVLKTSKGKQQLFKPRVSKLDEITIDDIDTPRIVAHREGHAMVIDWMEVPESQQRKGLGSAYYLEWEKKLPTDIVLVKLQAADAGNGASNDFWDALGFDYMYADIEDLDYEYLNTMWKGVNGHPTPAQLK